MQPTGIDLLAITGDEGLQGPPGTGRLVLNRPSGEAWRDKLLQRVQPLLHGSTGSRSEWEPQPDDLLEALECGTQNGPSQARLETGMAWPHGRGLDGLLRSAISAR